VLFSTRAPGKVNLILRVGARREDGYHEIESLMVPLDLADDVEVNIWPGRAGQVVCRCPNRPELDGADNLAARAACLFRDRAGVTDRCEIRIVKRIPVTAGLGGGSSDAAAVLRCLARAYRFRDRALMCAMAAEVGSDVPFFLAGRPAWVRGWGERISPVSVPSLTLLLAYPRDLRLAVSASEAYQWFDESRSGSPRLKSGKPARFRPNQLRNDLEPACLEHHPELRNLILRLEGTGATSAIMSGSGPTVFGLFADRKTARCAARAFSGDRVENAAALDLMVARTTRLPPGVASWKSPRSASSPSMRKSSRRT
jgi:4-diphosphocytidyl-2-C-methyl-D-erythritol kinase